MYSTFFVNNRTYGADDINKVLAHLTTQGVSTFVDTGDALMDLDTAMSNLTSEGAQVYDNSGCKVVSAGNGFYKISKGCYWLASGACIIFDDEGYVFELNFMDSAGTKGTTCYVYLRQGGAESEGVSNDINIIVSGEAPADTDALLATISSAGAITDNRKVAVSKLSVHSSDPVKTLTVNFSASGTPTLLGSEYSPYGYIWCTKGNGNTNEKYVFYLIKLSSEWKTIVSYCPYSGASTNYLKARKTANGIEFSNIGIYNLSGNYESFTVQLFLGAPL